MKLKSANFKAHLVMGFALALSSCSQSSEKKEAGTKPSTKDPGTTPAATTPETPTADATGTAESQVCWDKLLKTPAAVACTGLYAYSSKTCVAGFTKVATCDAAAITAAYGTSKLNGTPVMTSVNQWISEGYQPTCLTGSDSKFYVYFLKKSFTATAATTTSTTSVSGGQYSIADKKLGAPGALLDSIKVQANSTAADISCE